MLDQSPMTSNEKDIYGALQTFFKNLNLPKRSETFIDELLPELLQRATHKQAPEQFLSAMEQNANKIFLHLQIPTQSEEATTRQKAVLGKYYQVTLPEHPSSATPDLRLLYETTLPQEEIEKIFQLIARNKEAKDPQVAAFLGPPGCGKTSGLFQIALKKFVTFFDCQSAGLGTDNNYFQMCTDIGNLPDCTDLETFSSWHANNLKKAKERVLLEYCARRIHLLLLLTKFPALESKNYLESQLSGGRSVIKSLVSILKTLDVSSVSALLDIVDEEIHLKGVAEDVVAIDEAGAAQYEQGNRIVSESAFKSGASASLKGEIIIPKIYKRGILGALTRTLLEKGNITVILASPDLGVREYDSLGTTLGKTGPHFVVNFKKLSREEHIQFFKKHFYIPEQAIKEAFSGPYWEFARPRFLEYLVRNLYNDIWKKNPDHGTGQWFINYVQFNESKIIGEVQKPVAEIVKAYPSVLKELGYYCAEAFKDDVFYLPAKHDEVGTVKNLLCYLKEVDGTLCYDKLEPFALATAKLVVGSSMTYNKSFN